MGVARPLKPEYSVRLSAEVARRRILNQHVGLRRLLKASLEAVRAALDGEGPGRAAFGVLVSATYLEFVRHLAEEEALLLPILEEDLPLGPQRAEALRDEHARQRAELDALRASRTTEDFDARAARFCSLVSALLVDMDHEEAELLTRDAIRDDGVVVDQCSG
jgi:hypothetical protein